MSLRLRIGARIADRVPAAIVGEFDRQFLELPEEVLVTGPAHGPQGRVLNLAFVVRAAVTGEGCGEIHEESG